MTGVPVLGAPDFLVVGADVVTADRVVPSGVIEVRGGLIRSVRPGTGADAGPSTGPDAGPGTTSDLPVVDATGLLALPGFVDTHCDGLEGEMRPRRGAPPVAADAAFVSFESRLRAAGVTTVFHCVGVREMTAHGVPVAPGSWRAIHERIAAADRGLVDHSLVDHREMVRLDLLSPSAVEDLHELLANRPVGADPLPVSLENHSPGQGQYRDPGVLADYIVATDGVGRAEALDRVEFLHRRREAGGAVVTRTLASVDQLVAAGRVRPVGHDPDTREAVDALAARGGRIAEFPITVEAAEYAIARGLGTVVGAPNILRGGSHAGNVSALELVRAGLVTAVASDFHPGALVGALAVLVTPVAEGGAGLTLPAAAELLSAGPARLSGLRDRGVLAVGMRADIVLVEPRPGTAVPRRVVGTLTARTV
ncbi:alpha-D-ribose 1-methylphosphonate 5-triphosphate diphosphatase [Rhodococcus sp. IEGM 1408]|uniref:alpha-D-ribose 1-methylphosphonate 5-triphosphate diphosphatase n=1 Tax=Rhodococcus sp. IEGM 1408 TaxID=3082220 RepID=UPI0029552E8F|nr:alpha-D-ribose 1-methylphosphonate 5-triphosphate diphosphatase [Rhodococcus sp. IEGM 1408]MDV8002291.1 alpha-D-ribose 1-methylphosphonate 5-triphosphate diphosphatase [Rhodococcus sp. IEGM 1408]